MQKKNIQKKMYKEKLKFKSKWKVLNKSIPNNN